MAKLKIKYLPAAVGDLDVIFDYIAADRPEAAIKMLDKIDGAVAMLAEQPYAGAVPSDEPIRRMQFRVFPVGPYLVFYKAKEEYVEIHRVLHVKQNYAIIMV